MLCSLCRKHSRRPKKTAVGKAVWIDLPCCNFVRQSLVRHSKTDHHVAALKLEASLVSSKRDGRITMAFEHVVSAERKAFLGYLKCMGQLTCRTSV